jgi:hypothetical protein
MINMGLVRFFFLLPSLLVCTLLLNGCSSLNGTRLEPLMGADVNLVKLGDKIAQTLIEQAVPPLFPRQPEQPIIVTTLVDNQQLNQTSDFGRNLQNTITSGFVKKGYISREIKLRGNVLVQANVGEFMLSRDLNEIAGKQNAQAVVVGTYTMTNRMMYLSIRLVTPQDRTIRAAYDDRLYLDENTLRMLNLQFKSQDSSMVKPPEESFIDKIFY